MNRILMPEIEARWVFQSMAIVDNFQGINIRRQTKRDIVVELLLMKEFVREQSLASRSSNTQTRRG